MTIHRGRRVTRASAKPAGARFPGVVAIVAAALPLAVQADVERGRLLYENHCAFCHASVVHIREQRKVTTPTELRAAIQRWSGELKLKWQENDVNDVQLYLNSLYYHFAPDTTPR